jgi:hypothetical protein
MDGVAAARRTATRAPKTPKLRACMAVINARGGGLLE